MCIGCAENYPIEEVDEVTLSKILGLIRDLYLLEHVGGPLHVPLDDWNIEDHFWEPYLGDFSYEVMDIAENICFEMLRLTIGQRNFIMLEAEKQAWR